MKGDSVLRSYLPHELHALTGVNITIHHGMENRLACMKQVLLAAALNVGDRFQEQLQ